MLPNFRNTAKTECIGVVAIPGRVPFSTAGVYSSLSKTPGGGSAMTFTSSIAGTAGDALHVVATADGNAKAAVSFGTYCTQLDTVMEYKTVGTGGNSWTVSVIPHTVLGGGAFFNEDTVNKKLTILFETGVTTVANIETAIGLTTNFAVKTTGTGTNVLAAATDTAYDSALAGGTADTWAEWTSGTGTLTVHFTNATSTTLTIKTAVNALTGASITASSGVNTDTWATGDAFGSTHLAGGVAASALDSTAVVGEGFTVARTGGVGDGTVTITFSKLYREMHAAQYGLQLNSAANTILELGAYDATAGTIKITPRTLAGTTTEPAPGANNKIHFCFYMRQ